MCNKMIKTIKKFNICNLKFRASNDFHLSFVIATIQLTYIKCIVVIYLSLIENEDFKTNKLSIAS